MAAPLAPASQPVILRAGPQGRTRYGFASKATAGPSLDTVDTRRLVHLEGVRQCKHQPREREFWRRRLRSNSSSQSRGNKRLQVREPGPRYFAAGPAALPSAAQAQKL